ncbi:MAG TPA: (2Fe-2S)-binding protein [Sporichthyaceae bacterium]|nr:(2Fe-2S)-binding protein [Sporichthyaceae bacterium]
MVSASIATALDACAAAGPFFVLDTDPPTGSATDASAPPWRRFCALTEDPAVLGQRVDAVARAVADRAGIEPARVDRRSAASLVHLGLAARLVCPPLGTALLGGMLLDLDGSRLWWRDVLGPVPLALPEATGRSIGSAEVATVVAALAADLSSGPMAALVEAVAALGVSRKVLWGNVASAVAGARVGLVAAAPEHAPRIRATVEGLLEGGAFAGVGTFSGPAQARAFRRNSCCLYYRVPGGGYCGDCVLA